MLRELDYQAVVFDPLTGEPIYSIEPREDDFPVFELSLIGDSAVFADYGPVSGRRYRFNGSYAPMTDGGGTLTANADFEVRQYIQATERSNFSLRFFGGAAWGEFPTPYYFGGLDTVRGFDYRSLAGDRAFFANLEFRFPLVDAFITPIFGFRGIRGRIFLDVGGAWWDYAGETFTFWNSDEGRLEDAVSAYGWGITVAFGGLDLNWDFAQQWDFSSSTEDGFRTSFWIGTGF
jgi:outer membrane protein assembly factor BamA